MRGRRTGDTKGKAVEYRTTMRGEETEVEEELSKGRGRVPGGRGVERRLGLVEGWRRGRAG